MACIGTSEPPKLAEYDVFLSFRGPDTRKTFADCLYHGLIGCGIRVFRDDEELYKGKEIATELPLAIDNSRICIPIFSKNYATSAWCLREVAHMVECRRKSGGAVEILPIFYDVEVSDVKLQPGSTYEVHIEEHRARFEEEVILQWKNALKEVGKLKGYNGKSARGHGELIKSIVGGIVVKLNIKYRNIPTHSVGLQDQVAELIKLVDIGSEDVRFIVIHGMGGIGKTTLANAVFNQLYSNYEGFSFLENVRERTKQHDLLYLQKKLLHDILNHDFGKDVRDINDGINIIRGRLCFKKALIVIDNVDEDGQLKNLARSSSWFGSGSRIIITTRDRGIMEGEAHKYYYYEVKQMLFNDALCLFSWHAFGRDCPPHKYIDISRNIVASMAGLPLALEVVGSLLSCKCLESCACMEIWKDTLNELRRVPNRKVEETLMISINKLNDQQRLVFLDIACFLINEDKTNAIYMWSACKISPHLVMNFLIQKSLIKIDNDNRFWMHDHLRDLGREIVRREIFHNFGGPSRVWIDQEVKEIINSNQVGNKLGEQVEVLCLNSGNFTLTYDAFVKLRNLRFLKLQGQFKRNFKGLFKGHLDLLPNLRWLCWRHLPSNFNMKNFCLRNLAVLELCNSSITGHWKGWRQLKTDSKLKVLDLTGCRRLKRTPDFSSFFLLERLILKGCHKLVEIDQSIVMLGKLTYLNLEGCNSLKKLPEEICRLTSLTTIIMQGQGQKFQLPNSMANLTSMTSLSIRDVSIFKLPESIGKLTNLSHLSLINCKELKKLPDSIGNLKSLVELNVSKSKEITKLPDSIGNLKRLKVINMSGSGISGLPTAIGLLKNLERINAMDCSGLTGEIPVEIGDLSALKILNFWGCKICGIPESIYKLSHLKSLCMTLSEEYEITELPWICKLSKLESFGIASPHVTMLKLPSGLTALSIQDLTFKSTTPSNDGYPLAAAIPCLEELQMLRKLTLISCNFCDLDGLHLLTNLRKLVIMRYHKRFPDLSNLRNLIFLNLCECDGLVEIHGLGELQLLQNLIIEGCNSLEMLNGLPNLINLKLLFIEDCDKLTGVQGLDKLESLVFLRIQDCSSLETLPDISLLDGELNFLSIDCPMLPKQIGANDYDIFIKEAVQRFLDD